MRPRSVFGAISPKPTVVIVVIAQYTPTGMLVKPVGGPFDHVHQRTHDQDDQHHEGR